MSRAARYAYDNVIWSIVENEDTDWVESGGDLILMAVLVAELYNKLDEIVREDVAKALRLRTARVGQSASDER
jgi:hypothetical protein